MRSPKLLTDDAQASKASAHERKEADTGTARENMPVSHRYILQAYVGPYFEESETKCSATVS